KRGIYVSRAAGEDEGVEFADLGKELVFGEFQGKRDGLGVGCAYRAEVIVEFFADALIFFLGGAPGDAHSRARSPAIYCFRGGHRNLHCSARAASAATQAVVLRHSGWCTSHEKASGPEMRP